MTFHAARELDYIVVTATHGPVTFTIQEHASHIGHFWGELGKLLSESEKARVVPYVQVVELPEGPQGDPGEVFATDDEVQHAYREGEFRDSGTGPGDAA